MPVTGSKQTDPAHVRLESGEISSVIARVRVPGDAASPGGHDLTFIARHGEDNSISTERKSRFIMPMN